MNQRRARRPLWLSIAVVLAELTACNDGESRSTSEQSGRPQPTGTAGSSSADPTLPPSNAGPCGAGEFDSTFAGIQKVIFEGHGCTNGMCHGAAAQGGLDLRADVSYQNLLQINSKSSPLFRVMPADPNQSFLYNKLRAATDPGSVKIEGSPMPNALAPLTPEHLEVVRRWIEAGAPRKGSIGDDVTGRADGIAKLLGACLPEATPNAIAPLDPPAAHEGVQLVIAPIQLKAGSEIDVCWAQYYDLSDVVPPELQDRERGIFYVNGQRTRQDPLSHHLVVSDSELGAASVNDPAFGKWACRGDNGAGEPCDPLQPNACSSGQCASEVQAKSACQGFGPAVKGGGGVGIFGKGLGRITGSQTAQYYRPPREGVYETVPIKGIMYVNPHAFNLTNHEATLHGWINLFYAKGDLKQQHELILVNALNNINIATGTPPFTKKSFCAKWVAQQNTTMYTLSSHTHKRGHHFTVDLSDGTRIYTNEIYSDPVVEVFDPPMVFDSADPAERTLTYCAEYNNGLAADGGWDTDIVTRLSTMPDRTTCTPVACVAGKIAAPCQGASDNAACDSSPGAGDGWCDACPITAGQTTENEMFIMIPMVVLP
jgi:hypothetical protein